MPVTTTTTTTTQSRDHDERESAIRNLIESAEENFLEGFWNEALQAANTVLRVSTALEYDSTNRVVDEPNHPPPFHVRIEFPPNQTSLSLFLYLFPIRHQDPDSTGNFILVKLQSKGDEPATLYDRAGAIVLQCCFELSRKLRGGSPIRKELCVTSAAAGVTTTTTTDSLLQPFVDRYVSTTSSDGPSTAMSLELFLVLIRFCQATNNFIMAVQLVSQMILFSTSEHCDEYMSNQSKLLLVELAEILWLDLLPFCCEATRDVVLWFRHDCNTRSHSISSRACTWRKRDRPQKEALEFLIQHGNPIHWFAEATSARSSPSWLLQAYQKCDTEWNALLVTAEWNERSSVPLNESVTKWRGNSGKLLNLFGIDGPNHHHQLLAWMKSNLANTMTVVKRAFDYLQKHMRDSVQEGEYGNSGVMIMTLTGVIGIFTLWVAARRYHLRRKLLHFLTITVWRNMVWKPTMEVVDALLLPDRAQSRE